MNHLARSSVCLQSSMTEIVILRGPTNHFEELPKDVHLYVFSFLDVHSLGKTSRVVYNTIEQQGL